MKERKEICKEPDGQRQACNSDEEGATAWSSSVDLMAPEVTALSQPCEFLRKALVHQECVPHDTFKMRMSTNQLRNTFFQLRK
jgi:hypothetical protein